MMRNLIAALTLFFSAASALATAIVYDESVDGDLFRQTVNLAEGSNTVLGQAFLSDLSADFDTFFFVVPENMWLESITFTVLATYQTGFSSAGSVSYVLRDGVTNDYLGSAGRADTLTPTGSVSLFEDPLPFSSDFTGLLPLGGGSYFLTHGLQHSGGAGVPYHNTWDYSLTFSVVPIPPAMMLFASALIWLGWRKREIT